MEIEPLKILIVGANGFLGRPIAQEFEDIGFDVIRVGRSRLTNPSGFSEVGDILDEESMVSILRRIKPKIVLSTAWDTDHGNFWTSPLNSTYRDATLSFAKNCFELNVESFIGLGTVSEYGRNSGSCNSSRTPVDPVNPYAEAKIFTGQALQRLGEEYGTRTQWLRIFQAYGPNEKPQRFVPSLISSLRKRNTFKINTPDNKLDWIHSLDIASAIAYSYRHNLDHFVDVGTGLGTTTADLAEMLCEELDLDSSLIEYSADQSTPTNIQFMDPDSQLLKRGWTPKLTLRQRLASLG